jgi:NADPH:quinone reductase-like Zn-dependent oxidoreductase
MKAVAISEFNAELSATETAAPTPADGELLIDVEFSSINGMDAMTWAGYIEGMMPYEMPITLGRDFLGTVVGLGAGITGFEIGEAVFGLLMSMPLHGGTWAEQAVVPAWGVVKRPNGLDAATGGALALAGTAARSGVDALALQGGDTVLICGATGGVGAMAVQLAKSTGATVIATAATPDEAAFVRELGADQAVNYRKDLVKEVKALYPNGCRCRPARRRRWYRPCRSAPPGQPVRVDPRRRTRPARRSRRCGHRCDGRSKSTITR